ncbi:HEAT repeat-containing protein 6 [Musca vetustissima]|uniref:HEAT repeat-containing protein 6 n=1 Tax=Musca vetustissima TaxID=27455 RepID=UPI002AB6BB27|nr:HEAT repeat-containing protein 6 [Musca vetustissima]
MNNFETTINHLRRCRSENKDLLEVTNLIDHVVKYGCENKAQQQRIIDEIIRFVTNNNSIPDEILVVCVVALVTHLQEQKKLSCFNTSQVDQVVQSLIRILRNSNDDTDTVSKICSVFCSILTTQPMNINEYFAQTARGLTNHLTWDSGRDVIINIIRCLDCMVGALNCGQTSPTNEIVDTCAEIGGKMLMLFYNSHDYVATLGVDIVPTYLLHSLQMINCIISINAEFARKNISELLGLSRAYLHFGIEQIDSVPSAPQRVYMSQQALYDSAEDFDSNINAERIRSCGGKAQKNRKPRIKTNSNHDRKVPNSSPERKGTLLSMDMKTSDSDTSEQESAGNNVLFERNKMAKIRLASISLVGSIVKTVERRILYGYWHALFPSGTGDSVDNLLYVGQHDPNMRCRCAAIQVCAQLLYGSKGFLHQAEINEKRCPSTFIPFSVSLGHTTLAIYQSLTTMLSTESSLPVLTQTLKCLAVLVQGTPFQKFDKEFIQNLVRHVRPLIYHRDAAIQVSSLMVLEFLISSTDACIEIAEAVGLPKGTGIRSFAKSPNMLGEDDLDIINDEEYVESDLSDDEKSKSDNDMLSSHSVKMSEHPPVNGHFWLLLRVLHNLSCNGNATVAASIRIESLQVLTAMCLNFSMLKPHLANVTVVLKQAMDDSLPDVRLYAARCIDSCAFQISRQIMEASNTSSSQAEVKCYSTFWRDIIPILMDHIRRDRDETSTVRIVLCDVLSNIGVIMFENCSQSIQLSLLSFLSGVASDCSDEPIVRAAAVRALAVYVLYPSLRGDLVFVENTADLTLRLVADSNLLVRVKSFWALGNISDALIGKLVDSKANPERISDDLLYRMIKVSTTACSDNDKVRCNAVRTLGNLLRLLTEEHFKTENVQRDWRDLFEKSICKLTDCLRSSGNAKVKWNTCYAIGNIMRNHIIFKNGTVTDLLSWQQTLYSALCHVIVNHTNFKVRTNATAAIMNISERSHFGSYFEKFWTSILEAIEQSHNLENFHEYNHRDNLQEQLCLALAHFVQISHKEDWPMLKRQLSQRVDIVRNTWTRVVLRMIPEKAAPLLSCTVILAERLKLATDISVEQKIAGEFVCNALAIE